MAQLSDKEVVEFHKFMGTFAQVTNKAKLLQEENTSLKEQVKSLQDENHKLREQYNNLVEKVINKL